MRFYLKGERLLQFKTQNQKKMKETGVCNSSEN